MNDVIARALFESFKTWGSKDLKYKKSYRKLDDAAYAIIRAAFEELQIYKPGQYEFWWTNQHMRFIKSVSNQQTRLVHELMYHFLTKYSRGELEKKNAKKTRQDEARLVG